jgi:hypothetical protein
MAREREKMWYHYIKSLYCIEVMGSDSKTAWNASQKKPLA